MASICQAVMRRDQLVARPAHAAARETGPLDERVGDMRSVRGRVLGAAALAPTGARTHAIWRSASRVWLLERTSSSTSNGGADVSSPPQIVRIISANAVSASTPISNAGFESCVTVNRAGRSRRDGLTGSFA